MAGWIGGLNNFFAQKKALNVSGLVLDLATLLSICRFILASLTC